MSIESDKILYMPIGTLEEILDKVEKYLDIGKHDNARIVMINYTLLTIQGQESTKELETRCESLLMRILQRQEL